METLSKAVDSTRVDCSRKLAESETLHSDHTKSLEDNYLQLIDTLNTKLKVNSSLDLTFNTKLKVNKFPWFDIFAKYIIFKSFQLIAQFIIYTKLTSDF